MSEKEYAGFWIRAGATIIDSILLLIIILPILISIYGPDYIFSETLVQGFWDIIFSYILPAIAVILFWVYKSATPGKMVTRLTIVDAKTGDKPSAKQCLIRYFGYYLSVIPLFLGMIWVVFDKRKQGWHDKLAGTVVIRNSHLKPAVCEEKA